MHAAVVDQLRAINRQFYEQFAAEYSQSRRELQPGMSRALHALGDFDSLLDVGCGDGRVGWAIADGALGRSLTNYVGIDGSLALMNQRGGLPAQLKTWQGHVVDLCEPGWSAALQKKAPFAAAVCFSVLHHIPSTSLRQQLLTELVTLLQPGARVAISVWQLLHHERFQLKLVDPTTVGLRAEQLEPGDILVDWQMGGSGVRYVHEFTLEELGDELHAAGLTLSEHWRSDGKTGDLGLYAIAD